MRFVIYSGLAFTVALSTTCPAAAENSVTVEQTGNALSALISQEGGGHQATVSMFGEGHDATLTQSGDGNSAVYRRWRTAAMTAPSSRTVVA